MKFTIKKRTTDEIMFEGEADNFKDFVVLHKANLQGADLQGANLRRADLWWADLRRAQITITQKEDLLKATGIVSESN